MARRSIRSAADGYATAEIAVALPAVMIVVLMAVWLLGCVGAWTRRGPQPDRPRAGIRPLRS